MKKYDVFISYSSLDQKVVEGLCAYLEQHKIRCFVAYRDIPVCEPWPTHITEALSESQMMVVVFSKNFNHSKEVDRELTIASKKKMPILTFRLSDEEFKGTKEYYLSNINWIDAFPEPKKVFGAVTENVKKLIGVTEHSDEEHSDEEHSDEEHSDGEQQQIQEKENPPTTDKLTKLETLIYFLPIILAVVLQGPFYMVLLALFLICVLVIQIIVWIKKLKGQDLIRRQKVLNHLWRALIIGGVLLIVKMQIS